MIANMDNERGPMNKPRYLTVATLALLLATLTLTTDTAQAQSQITVPYIEIEVGPEVSDGHWNPVHVYDETLMGSGLTVLRGRVHIVSDSDPMGEWVDVEGANGRYHAIYLASHTEGPDVPGVLRVQPCDYVSAMYYRTNHGHNLKAGDMAMAGTHHDCPKDPLLARIEMLERKIYRLCEHVKIMVGELYHVCAQ